MLSLEPSVAHEIKAPAILWLVESIRIAGKMRSLADRCWTACQKSVSMEGVPTRWGN